MILYLNKERKKLTDEKKNMNSYFYLTEYFLRMTIKMMNKVKILVGSKRIQVLWNFLPLCVKTPQGK